MKENNFFVPKVRSLEFCIVTKEYVTSFSELQGFV